MRPFLILGSIVLLVVVAWSGAWLYVAGLVRAEIDALALVDPQHGVQVRCETLDVSGYPFRLEAGCTGAEIASQDLSVSVAGVYAHVLVYRPTHLIASALGPAEVSDAFTGSRTRIGWESLSSSVRVDDWRIARLSLVAAKPVIDDVLTGEARIASATSGAFHLVDIPEAHDAAAGTSALALYAVLEGVAAPAPGIAEGRAELQAELTGLPDDLRAMGEASLPERLIGAEAGVRAIDLRLTENEDVLTATGAVALEAGGTLGGALDLTARGILERVGVELPQPMAGVLLGEPEEDGTYRRTLTIRSGVVLMGLIPLGVIPALF